MYSGQASKATVLLVDDHDDSRIVLRKSLESIGYGVIEATNGKEGVELAQSKCPDIVLLDLNMPVVDGLLAAERIRASKGRCSSVPIIAITAFDTYGMREAALDAGCNEYLTKPVEFSQVEEVLRRTLYKFSPSFR